MAKLEIEDVVVCFGDVVAVDRVSLQVEEGETVVLLGPSGCGKTTLLRLVAGFNRPKSGTVRIAGRIVASRRSWCRPRNGRSPWCSRAMRSGRTRPYSKTSPMGCGCAA